MAKKTQTEYNQIGGYVDYYWGKVEYCQNMINSKYDDIEDLENAIEYVQGKCDELNDSWTALKNVPSYANKWTGNNAEKFFDRCGDGSDLDEKYSRCMGIFEVIIEQMKDAKTRLQGDVSYWNGTKSEFNQSYQYYSTMYESYWRA